VPFRADSHEQLVSTAGWSKLDLDRRDKCKQVLLGLSLAGNLRRHEMNGRSQMQGGKNWILPKKINSNRFV
jgi:hypothetical protein